MWCESFYLSRFIDGEAIKKMNGELLKIIIYLTTWIGIVAITPRKESNLVALVVSVCVYLMTLILVFRFNSSLNFQFEYIVAVIPEYGLYLSLGVDGISLLLLFLTTAITPICIFSSISVHKKSKELILQILLIELFLIICFTVKNLFFFFVAFESVLIPMFIIIGG
jgi:NADH-quinone oxidoreductase subunit M